MRISASNWDSKANRWKRDDQTVPKNMVRNNKPTDDTVLFTVAQTASSFVEKIWKDQNHLSDSSSSINLETFEVMRVPSLFLWSTLSKILYSIKLTTGTTEMLPLLPSSLTCRWKYGAFRRQRPGHNDFGQVGTQFAANTKTASILSHSVWRSKRKAKFTCWPLFQKERQKKNHRVTMLWKNCIK